MRHLLALAACAAMACARAPPRMDPSDAPPELKLGRDVRPLHYALELTLSPEREHFQGEVAIDVELRQPAAKIWLHALDLTVREAWVEVGGDRAAAALDQVTSGGVARLVPARPVPAGRATVHVAFEGAWDERSSGLHRVRSGGGAYVFTQLDGMEARRVFPCFDEPAFKTPFDVTLIVPGDATAVSNAPVAREERASAATKRIRFESTAPLPTYLVFAGVGPFQVVAPPALPSNEVRVRPLPLRAVAPRGSGERLGPALEAASELLPILERWFGIPFPYQKLDLVVSPDLAFAAAENAGAILFRDEPVSFEPGHSPEEKRIRVGRLVARALALQWLGDLVTPESWEHAWLSESFATFMAWKAVETWRPDAHEPEAAAASIDAVMDAEGLPGARALRQPLRRGGDVRGELGHLSVKGAAVLRSFERFIGEAQFREGVRGYLRANAHGTGTTDAFLAALSRAAGRDLAPAFRTLLDQPGLPQVEARAACDAPGPRLELTVERRRVAGAASGPAPAFAVPVCARYEAAGTLGEACTLVEGGQATLPLPACPRWVMPAAGGTACYRWVLEAHDLSRLRDAGLLHLSAAERLSYAQSLRAAAWAGRVSYADALLALTPLARDGARRVATAPMVALEEAIDHLVLEEDRPQARARAAEIYRPRLRQLGLEPAAGEPLDTLGLRSDIAEFLVQVARDPDTTRALAARGASYARLAAGRSRFEGVSPDLLQTALSAAVIEGDEALFDALERRLHATVDGERRGRILAALGSARAPALSERALALASDPRLRGHERLGLLLAQASRPETRVAAWKALESRWDALAGSLAPGLAEALPEVTAGLCDRARVRGVERFLGKRVDEVPGARRRLRLALDSIEACAALREAQSASAQAYFTKR